MTPEDYLEKHSIELRNIEKPFKPGIYIKEDDAWEAVDMAKREIAQAIIDKNFKSLDEVWHYCYGIVDF